MEVAVWGDSITFGAGDVQGWGWVGRLRNQYFSDDSISIYNRGVCGDTSGDILKRFSVEAASIEPDKIIFAFGTNDSKYPGGSLENNVSQEQLLNNARQLLQEARKYTKDITFVGLTKANENVATDSGSTFNNKELEKYNAVLRELCSQENIPFRDIFDVIDPEIDLFDYVHPNEKGYEKMYKAIATRLPLQSVHT